MAGSRLPPTGCQRISARLPSANRCVERSRPALLSSPGRHEDGAGGVAEQDAGRAIGPVDDAREHLDPDHQHVLELPDADEGVGDRHPVEKAGAGRRQIEGAAAGRRAQLLLHEGGGGRERTVAGDGPHDDAVDDRRIDARLETGLPPRLGRQIAGRLRGIQDVALADAGALDDPGVGGVDHARQILVGQDLGGNRATGPDDATADHEIASAPGAEGAAASIRKAWRATAADSSLPRPICAKRSAT